MQTARALRESAHTNSYLVHTFGRGLDDDRYTVERFRSAADGDIRAKPNETRKGVSRRTVRQLRPARDEIVVCTGVRGGGGIQYWGSYVVWGQMLRRR